MMLLPSSAVLLVRQQLVTEGWLLGRRRWRKAACTSAVRVVGRRRRGRGLLGRKSRWSPSSKTASWVVVVFSCRCFLRLHTFRVSRPSPLNTSITRRSKAHVDPNGFSPLHREVVIDIARRSASHLHLLFLSPPRCPCTSTVRFAKKKSAYSTFPVNSFAAVIFAKHIYYLTQINMNCCRFLRYHQYLTLLLTPCMTFLPSGVSL